MDQSQSSERTLALAFVLSACLHAAALAIGHGLQHRHAIVPPVVLDAYLRSPAADPVPLPQQTAEDVTPRPQPEPRRALTPRTEVREQASHRKSLTKREKLVRSDFAEPQPEAPRAPPTGSAAADVVPGPAPPERAVATISSPPVAVSPPEFAAAYLRNPQPPYPLAARRNGESGTVLLKVFVTKEGAAGRVELDRSSSFAALDRAALEAVKLWRFVPAKRGEESLDAWVRVPIVFRLEGD